MYGRLIVIFLGLALFINSCNNLLSQWAGTYKLRTLTIDRATKEGIQDAEYIRLEGVCPGPELQTWEAPRRWRDGIVYFSLKPCSQAAVQSSYQPDFQYIGWVYLPKDSADRFYPGLPEGPLVVEGLVRQPPRPSRSEVSGRMETGKAQPVYLRLDAKPLHWSWHLAGMLVPVLLIGWMERRSFNRNRNV